MIGMERAKNIDGPDRDNAPAGKSVEKNRNSFSRYIGMFPAFSMQDEINAWIREVRGDDSADDPARIYQETPP